MNFTHNTVLNGKLNQAEITKVRVEMVSLEICKSKNCNNETEWIDEPEEYCHQCIGLMVDKIYIKEFRQQINSAIGVPKNLLGKQN